MKRAAESHPIGNRSGKGTGLNLGAVPPITDHQRAAVLALVTGQDDADTLADMLPGEALCHAS